MRRIQNIKKFENQFVFKLFNGFPMVFQLFFWVSHFSYGFRTMGDWLGSGQPAQDLVQEEPWGARRAQGGARGSQEEPGGARRSKEGPGGARRSQSQELPSLAVWRIRKAKKIREPIGFPSF